MAEARARRRMSRGKALIAWRRDPACRARWLAATRRGAQPRGERQRLTLHEILDRHVVPEPMSGCWLWMSASSGGYAKFSGQWAHRYLFEAFGGQIPRGFSLDHRCHVRSCVNPAHLEPITKNEKMQRA